MRELKNFDNRFQHNAWDSFEMPVEFVKNANLKLKNDKKFIKNQVAPLNNTAWDDFYNFHKTNFFKDRKWVEREIPINSFKRVLELGCGTGSSLISCDFNNVVIGYDFSESAIAICKEKFKGFKNAYFYTRDITKLGSFTHDKIDCLLLIFTLSAIPPDHHKNVFMNIKNILSRGGKIFFRDYGVMDMVQLRYKPEQIISDNFYKRPDGTYTYFFTCEYLRNIVEKCGLEVVELREDKKLLINRKRGLSMYRVQIVGIFSLQ
ncbi:Methyltransferase-like protein [Dictyocoela muelleri]|nr:Methyltransferase-like protein [Dictyocoela muelleri]